MAADARVHRTHCGGGCRRRVGVWLIKSPLWSRTPCASTNLAGQRATRHGDLDQAHKPEDLRKPISYYQRALANEDDCTGTGCSQYIEHFLENGTYLKLGELSVAYSFGRGALERLFGTSAPDRLTLRVNAQNVFTMSKYIGFDPEAASNSGIVSSNLPNPRAMVIGIDLSF
jgi:hypothetical protein